MRARVYSNGGNSTGGFTFNGGVMTGALYLAGNPSEALEAAAKQYVDSSLVNLNAANVVSGIFPTGRLPSFTGDLIKPAGSSTINLAPTGVVAGDFVKPTIDTKGRVTGGSTLTEADVPNMSWEKVNIGRPSTLNGYGITNGVSLTGGILSGFISFNGAITQSLQAVTKQYIDITLSNATGIAIGDIVRKPYTTTPAGFLKCNGAEVDKTTYSTLYSVINDRFSKKQLFTSGRPWEQQYQINEVQNSDISTWTTGPNVPFSLSGVGKFLVTKNRVYSIGGWDSGTNGVVSTIYTAPINDDGTVGTWVATTPFPVSNLGANYCIIKNKAYVFGGYRGDGSGTDTLTTVYSAPVNADGTIGNWVLVSNLPGVTFVANLVVTNTKVYIIGGALTNLTGSQSNKVYSANINSDGTLGTWVTEANIPFYKVDGNTIITKNRVYLCGGVTSLYTNSFTASVYTAPINSDGTLGSWVSATQLPSPAQGGSVYVTKNRVYIIGGNTPSGLVQSVIMAPINADGTLGTWNYVSNIPAVRTATSVFATKNKLYLVGGQGSSGTVNTAYVGTINGGLNDYSSYFAVDTNNYLMAGSGKPWQQQYQINSSQVSVDITGWNSTTSLPGILHSSTAVVTKNRVYMLGGHNGSAYVNTVYTAPINSDGTLGTWATGTSLPAALGVSQAVITKNRVHLIGGYISVPSTSVVYTAPINSDGTLGTWSTGTSLPAGKGWGQAVVIKNKVYFIGGSDGNNANSAWFSTTINTDGTLGTWASEPALPINVHSQCVAVTKNRIYILGGSNAGGSATNNYYSATINSDGLIGTWTNHGTLPVVITYSQVFVTQKRVYMIGGSNGSANHTVIWSAVINDDGSLGTFTSGATLPFSGYYHSIFATQNKLYWVGGIMQPGVASSTIYVANILDGINDYSPYYDGSILPVEPIDSSTTFALPDLTQNEKMDTVSYIKY